jgi:hypothetical protein
VVVVEALTPSPKTITRSSRRRRARSTPALQAPGPQVGQSPRSASNATRCGGPPPGALFTSVAISCTAGNRSRRQTAAIASRKPALTIVSRAPAAVSVRANRSNPGAISAASTAAATSSLCDACTSAICCAKQAAWLMVPASTASSSRRHASPVKRCRIASLHSRVVMVPS